MKTTWFAIPALLALAACDSSTTTDLICPPVYFAAVEVTAVDSVTNVNVTAGSTVVLSNATVTDSLDVPPGAATVAGVGSRAGTFTLRVRRSGYNLWQKSGVQVESGDCGPQTVRVTARLQPIGPSPMSAKRSR